MEAIVSCIALENDMDSSRWERRKQQLLIRVYHSLHNTNQHTNTCSCNGIKGLCFLWNVKVEPRSVMLAAINVKKMVDTSRLLG